MRATETEIDLSIYGTQLYKDLETETGKSTGYKPTGSITVARKGTGRMQHLMLNYSRAKSFGIQADIIQPHNIAQYFPIMNTDDLEGALWLPGDGCADPSDVCHSLAKGAKSRGMKIFENTGVVKINTEIDEFGHPIVHSVETSSGHTIRCEKLLNCGGQWARQIGKLSSPHVNVPLHSAEHFYVVTDHSDLDNNLPIFRDPDGYIYGREWSGGLLVGGFEPNAKPCFNDGVPNDFAYGLFDEDWDHFEILMNNALHRIPVLNNMSVRQMVNGPESFTPDNQYILGEAPEIKNYFVAAGFNSSGIASAAGAGKALSDWIINGNPTKDLWDLDIRRFGTFQNNPKYLKERVSESLGAHYSINWPKKEYMSGRPLRRSSTYERLKNAGACFGSKMGWERPNWFAPKGVEPKNIYSFTKQNWFKHTGNEHHNTRKNVTLFDQSSFSKFLMQGRDSVMVLQYLCSNNVDVDIGKIVYTGLLNEEGGFESDCTITRTGPTSFMIITSTAQTTRDSDWIRKNIPSDANCVLTDITSSLAVFGVMGPKSRELLSLATTSTLDDIQFGYQKEIDIDYANVKASRITYVGELGWELYIPTEFALTVYDSLFATAKKNNIALANGGYYAIESLRIEKGYRAWGHDITPKITPIEAGLSFAVDYSKDFIGKSALQKQKENGIKKRVVLFRFEDVEAYPLGKEPILRNGKVVGFLTSAAFGYTINSGVAIGIVNSEEGYQKGWLSQSKWQVEISGIVHNVRASLKPFHDPKNINILK
eukprot:TRINITY_DN7119_c0_g1_i3.p1 TRINITY_DN7119_c0_g1~~TRINITY_DN7119_c0_g1_i3.p1  ORF type:complete len:848 (-),score=168.82 TRINITY_DN7119_c0_g1_i3:12-2306(-)